MTSLIDALTVLVTSTMVGDEFAVAAFVHPQLSKLTVPGYASSAKLLATVLGKVMPLWYALALLLLGVDAYKHGTSHSSGRAIASAAVLWALVIVFTVTMLVPINNRIAQINPDAPYDGWLKDRAGWDRLHRVRVAVLFGCVCLLLFGVLPNS